MELNGQRIYKPFVEKPVSGEDHNIWVYYPHSMVRQREGVDAHGTPLVPEGTLLGSKSQSGSSVHSWHHLPSSTWCRYHARRLLSDTGEAGPRHSSRGRDVWRWVAKEVLGDLTLAHLALLTATPGRRRQVPVPQGGRQGLQVRQRARRARTAGRVVHLRGVPAHGGHGRQGVHGRAAVRQQGRWTEEKVGYRGTAVATTHPSGHLDTVRWIGPLTHETGLTLLQPSLVLPPQPHTVPLLLAQRP